MKTVIVTGPQGSGKSKHATRLARALGCEGVIEDWWPGDPLEQGRLHLTHAEMAGASTDARVIHIADALDLLADSRDGVHDAIVRASGVPTRP